MFRYLAAFTLLSVLTACGGGGGSAIVTGGGGGSAIVTGVDGADPNIEVGAVLEAAGQRFKVLAAGEEWIEVASYTQGFFQSADVVSLRLTRIGSTYRYQNNLITVEYSPKTSTITWVLTNDTTTFAELNAEFNRLGGTTNIGVGSYVIDGLSDGLSDIDGDKVADIYDTDDGTFKLDFKTSTSISGNFTLTKNGRTGSGEMSGTITEDLSITAEGTSFAAPRVSAKIAIASQKFPNLNAEQLVNLAKHTATDLGDPGVDSIYGHGKINLNGMLSPIGRLR